MHAVAVHIQPHVVAQAGRSVHGIGRVVCLRRYGRGRRRRRRCRHHDVGPVRAQCVGQGRERRHDRGARPHRQRPDVRPVDHAVVDIVIRRRHRRHIGQIGRFVGVDHRHGHQLHIARVRHENLEGHGLADDRRTRRGARAILLQRVARRLDLVRRVVCLREHRRGVGGRRRRHHRVRLRKPQRRRRRRERRHDRRRGPRRQRPDVRPIDRPVVRVVDRGRHRRHIGQISRVVGVRNRQGRQGHLARVDHGEDEDDRLADLRGAAQRARAVLLQRVADIQDLHRRLVGLRQQRQAVGRVGTGHHAICRVARLRAFDRHEFHRDRHGTAHRERTDVRPIDRSVVIVVHRCRHRRPVAQIGRVVGVLQRHRVQPHPARVGHHEVEGHRLAHGRRAAQRARQHLGERVARNIQHVFVFHRRFVALVRVVPVQRAVLGHLGPVRHRARRAVDQHRREAEQQRLADLDGIGWLAAGRIAGDRDRGVSGIARKAKREAVRHQDRRNGVRVPPDRRQDVFDLYVERRRQASVGDHQIDHHHAVRSRGHRLRDRQARFDHVHVHHAAGGNGRLSVIGHRRRVRQHRHPVAVHGNRQAVVAGHIQRQQIELDRERVVRPVVVVRHHRQAFEREGHVIARIAQRRNDGRARQGAGKPGGIHADAARHIAHPRWNRIDHRQIGDRRFGQRHGQPVGRPLADRHGGAGRVRRTGLRRARQRLCDDHVGNAQRVLRRIRVAALDADDVGLVDRVRAERGAVRVDRTRLHRLRQTHRERELQRFANFQRVGRLVEARRIADIVNRRIGRPGHHREREPVGHGAVCDGSRVENRAVQHVRDVEIVGRRQPAVGHHQGHRDLVARVAAVRRHRLGNRELRLDQGDRRPGHRRRRIRVARIGHAGAVRQHGLRRQPRVGRQVQDHRVVAQHQNRIGSAGLVLQQRVAFPNHHQVFAARAQHPRVRRDVRHRSKLPRRIVGEDLQRADHVGHARRQVVADRQIGNRQVGQFHGDLIGRDFADLQVRARRIRRPGLARRDQQLARLEILGDEDRRIGVAGVALLVPEVRARQRVAGHRREVRHRHVRRQRVRHADIEGERQRLADLDRVRARRRIRVRQDPEGVANHFIDKPGGQHHVGQLAQVVDQWIEHVLDHHIVGRRRARIRHDQRDRQQVVCRHIVRRRQRLEDAQPRFDGLDHDGQRVARPQRVVEVGHVRPVRQQALRRQSGNRGGIQHEGVQPQRKRVVPRNVVPRHHGVAEKLDGDRSAVRAERTDVRGHGRPRRHRSVETGGIHGHGPHHERHARRHEIAERQVRHRAFGQREVELVGHHFADLHVRGGGIRRIVRLAGAEQGLGETPRQARDRVARIGRVAPLNLVEVRGTQRVPVQGGDVGGRQQRRHVGRHGHLEGELQEFAHLDGVGARRAVRVGSDRQRIANQAKHEAGRRHGVGHRRRIEINGVEQVGDRHVVGRCQAGVGNRQLDVDHVARVHVGLHDVLRQRQARLDDGGGRHGRRHRAARIAAIGQRRPVRVHRLAGEQPVVGRVVQHEVVRQQIEDVVVRVVVRRHHHVREAEGHRLPHRRDRRGRRGRILREAAGVAGESGRIQAGGFIDVGQPVVGKRVHHRQVGDRGFRQRDGQAVGDHFADLNVRAGRIRRVVGLARRLERLGQRQSRHPEVGGAVRRVVALPNPARR